MYETTADLNEQWHDARMEADMEMYEMRQAAMQREADRKAGNCWHDGGFMFRAEAFYPEQVGLTQGQMWCHDCQDAVRTDDIDCHLCGLNEYNCMGKRGYTDTHDDFVTPPMILVSVAPAGGF